MYVSANLGYSNQEVKKIDLFCGIVVLSLSVNDEGILWFIFFFAFEKVQMLILPFALKVM